MTSDQTGPAGATCWHDDDPAECVHCLTARLAHTEGAYERMKAECAAQRARAEAAEVEATDLQRSWGEMSYRLAQVEADRDRERQRAEAAERGRLEDVNDRVSVYREFADIIKELEADRDRERQRAEGLAALLRRGREAIDWGGDAALLRDVDAALSGAKGVDDGR